MLKILLTPTLALLIIQSYGQWKDSFSDGNLSHSPNWRGEITKFIVENGMLRLYDSIYSGNSSIYGDFPALSSFEFSFYYRMDFNPSSSNYFSVLLKGTHETFELRLGGSTTDQISLFSLPGKQTIASPEGFLDKPVNEGWIHVSFADSVLTLEFSIEKSTEKQVFGTMNLAENPLISTLEFQCHYTTTRWNKFYFDDVSLSGEYYHDHTKPFVTAYEPKDSTSISVVFSEPVEYISPDQVYILPDTIVPVFTEIIAEKAVFAFLEPFPSGKYFDLVINNVADSAGNFMSDTLAFQYIHKVPSLYREVVFSEVMFDPTPRQGLPESEYLELLNRSDQDFSLENWMISDGKDSVQLADFNLYQGMYVLLSPKGMGPYFENVDVLEVENWITLTNSGKSLFLIDPFGNVTDSVTYHRLMHERSKEEGGWSLEMISTEHRCASETNWASSIAEEGGTPGKANSQFSITNQRPRMEDSYLIGDSLLLMHFDQEIVDGQRSLEATFFPENLIVLSKRTGIDRKSLLFDIEGSPDKKQLYTFSLQGVEFCDGQDSIDFEGIFAVISEAKEGEILVNEVLPDPVHGGEKFLELLNTSSSYFDLSKVKLSYYRTLKEGAAELLGNYYLFEPGKPIALSQDPEIVRRNYRVGNEAIILQSDIPTLSSESGYLEVFYNGNRTDSVYYDNKFHFEVLSTVKGVSFERVVPKNHYQPWLSASQSSNYGTPGRQNSSLYDGNTARGEIEVDPTVMSVHTSLYEPMKIYYALDVGSWAVSGHIYDLNGRLIKEIANNEISTGKGMMIWEGFSESGSVLPDGLYVVLVTAWSDTGQVKYLKRVIGVGR